MTRTIYLLWLITVMSISTVCSQMTEHDMKPLHLVRQSTLNQLVDSLDYHKTHRVLRLKESFIMLDKEEQKSVPASSLGLGAIFKIIAYVAIAGLIGTLMYLLIGQIKSDQKIEATTTDTDNIEDIENIEDVNAQSGYEEALSQGDYRSAIRMQFILVLQHLSERKKIDWRIDKTNREYLRELRSTSYFIPFSSLSYIYEWVWYGHTEIEEPVFNEVNEEFIAFIKRYIPIQTA